MKTSRSLTKTSNPRGRIVTRRYTVKLLTAGIAAGEPDCDQGKVCGYPLTWNPDDERFYVHDRGTFDGTNVLATRATFVAAVRFARRRAGL